jgi:hypothetical protein
MKLLLGSVALPAAVSIVVAFAVLGGIRGDAGRRYAGALALAIGFVSAYAILEPTAWRPTMYWHWLPWVAFGGAIVGPVALATRLHLPERWALMVVLAVISAWFLVPTRTSLEPSRGTHIAIYTVSATVVWALLDLLATRVSGPALCAALSVTLLSGGALVAGLVSLRFGLLGVAASAALSGGFITSFRQQDSAIVRGLLPAQTVMLGGVMLAAQVNVGLPLPSLILISIAPLAMWSCEAGPLSKLRGTWAYVVRFGAVSLPLAAAWGLSLPLLRSESRW